MGLSKYAIKSIMQSSKGRPKMAMRAVFVWTFLASSVIVVFHQIRQTRKVSRYITRKEPSNVLLPDWGAKLPNTNNNNNSSTTAADFFHSWLWTEETGDDDNVLNDDNIFADDDTDNNNGDAEEEAVENPNNGNSNTDMEDATAVKKAKLNLKIKELRRDLEEYAKTHGGQISPKLMAQYQQLLHQKRKTSKRNRGDLGKYYETRGKSQIEKARDYYQGVSDERKGSLAQIREERRIRQRQGGDWSPPGYNTTDYTQYPILPMENRVLPDMSQTGGIIFFLHIPKTVSADSYCRH